MHMLELWDASGYLYYPSIIPYTDALRVATAQPKLSVPRRVAGDIAVHQHGYCRVHVHPKRFPLAYTADWQVHVQHTWRRQVCDSLAAAMHS